MDIRNSQRKSPRSSTRSEKKTPEHSVPSSTGRDENNEERYMDRSMDHVARVRAAREAAQREMESFGGVSEYEVTIIHGRLKEEPGGPPQASLEFPTNTARDQREEK